MYFRSLTVDGRVLVVSTAALKIISGGQTGVDRAALDAAFVAGASCGGWCRAGRIAEDGRIPDRYPLMELPGAGYLQRTRKNVEDSDGTLAIIFGMPTGGTARTVEFCLRLGKPFCVVDGNVATVDAAVQQSMEFVRRQNIQHLNVAGPRGSGEARGYAYALAVVSGLLRVFLDGQR
jgi:hypothetical protein